MKLTLGDITTFAASVAVGCGAAIAIASAAAISESAASLRQVQPAPVEVIRLEPVVVTVSKNYFETVRKVETEVARGGDASKVTRG